jgi:predicted DNA-binding protein (MmcQ/YjbR family)
VLDHPWGDTVFKVRGKIFVFLGRDACTVKPFPEELDLLLGRPDVVRSKYIGRYGWITMTINDDETLELAKSLIDDTYAQVRRSKLTPLGRGGGVRMAGEPGLVCAARPE